MKVALITEWLDAWRGGAETSTQQFLHHLMDSHVDLHIFTRSRPSPTPGMAVHSVNGAAMSRTRRSVTFGRRVESRLREGGFDIVHAITPCRRATIYQPRGGTVAESIERNVALRRWSAGQRLKRCSSRLNFKQRYVLRLERELFSTESPTIIVSISDYVTRQLRNHYNVSDSRICKIYNGVEVDATPRPTRREVRRAIRAEFGVREDDLLVLSVAHNFRLKGVHRWLEALSDLLCRGGREIRALVVGRGDSSAWHRMAARLGVSRAVTFVGPSDRPAAFYHAADVLVHPTYYDPCSRVVLEAMASGLPVITTKWDGSSEMIRHGENGFVLNDPADRTDLVRCIEALYEPEPRERMGVEASRIADQVSMAKHAREMLALYERIANERGARS